MAKRIRKVVEEEFIAEDEEQFENEDEPGQTERQPPRPDVSGGTEDPGADNPEGDDSAA